jgi:hypothetical protein
MPRPDRPKRWWRSRLGGEWGDVPGWGPDHGDDGRTIHVPKYPHIFL